MQEVARLKYTGTKAVSDTISVYIPGSTNNYCIYLVLHSRLSYFSNFEQENCKVLKYKTNQSCYELRLNQLNIIGQTFKNFKFTFIYRKVAIFVFI